MNNKEQIEQELQYCSDNEEYNRIKAAVVDALREAFSYREGANVAHSHYDSQRKRELELQLKVLELQEQLASK